jgi:hypothetical protein
MSDAIFLRLSAIEARLAALESRPASSGSASGAVAPDSDLDSQWGDPVVRKDPKRWLESGGASFVGVPFSQCPPDYLDALASLADWKAGKDDEKGTEEGAKYAKYARKDAARARGWAARIRSGKVAQVPQAAPAKRMIDTSAFDGPPDDFGDDSSIPF